MAGRPSLDPPPRALVELVQRHAGDARALWAWIDRVQDAQATGGRAAAPRARGAVNTPVPVAQRMAERLLQGRQRGERLRVLDAGCGAGRLLAAVLRRAQTGGVRVACTGIEVDAAAARWAAWLEPVLRAAAPAALTSWRIAHADFLLAPVPRARFDAAIANPPYVPLRHLDATYRARLRAQADGVGRGDVAVLFVDRLLRSLRPGGRLCVIVPNKLLAAAYAAGLRRRLLAGTRLEEIWDLAGERVFRGRATYPVILVLRRRRPRPDDAVTVFDVGRRVRACWRQADLLGLPQHVVPLTLPADALPLFRRVLAGPRLGDRVAVACGIATPGFGRAVGRGRARIICSGDVGPFRVLARRRFAPERVAVPRRSLRRQRVAKVVIPGMFRRLHAAFDARGDLLGRVYYVPIDGSGAGPANERRALLLALLNSRLYAVLYRGLFAAVAQSGGWVRLNAPYLRCLPWPPCAPPARLVAAVRRLERGGNAAARSRLDACVESMFALGASERRVLSRLDASLHEDCARR